MRSRSWQPAAGTACPTLPHPGVPSGAAVCAPAGRPGSEADPISPPLLVTQGSAAACAADPVRLTAGSVEDEMRTARLLTQKLRPDVDKPLRSEVALAAALQAFTFLPDTQLHADVNDARRTQEALTAVLQAFNDVPDVRTNSTCDLAECSNTRPEPTASGGGGDQEQQQQQQQQQQRRRQTSTANKMVIRAFLSNCAEYRDTVQAFFRSKRFSSRQDAPGAASGGASERAATAAAAASVSASKLAWYKDKDLLFVIFTHLCQFFVLAYFLYDLCQPLFSLSEGDVYSSAMVTDRLNVSFYVQQPNNLHFTHPWNSSAWTRLQSQVETAFYKTVNTECEQQQRAMYRSLTWGRAEEALALSAPACVKMEELIVQLAQWLESVAPPAI